MSTSNTTRSLSGEQIVEALLGGFLLGVASGDGRRRGAARLTAAGLLLAAFAPSFTRQLLRVGAARRRVHLRTTLEIHRPVHDVFEFCRDFENFPRVVHLLHSVVDYQDGRSHWEVKSPGGELLAWDVQVTKYVPNVVLAWRSVPRSVVDCNGLIRFAPVPDGGTRLEIEVDYDPVHTGFSDAVRSLFDRPRTAQVEADLARANSYLQAHPTASRTELDEVDVSPHSA